MLIGLHPIEMRPPKSLFSQQTGFSQHSPSPKPRMLMGEHVIPTRISRSERTMPRRPRRVFATGLEADSTLSQHCADPVVHHPVEVGVEEGLLRFSYALEGPLFDSLRRFLGIAMGRPRDRRCAFVNPLYGSAMGLATARRERLSTMTAERRESMVVGSSEHLGCLRSRTGEPLC